MIHSIERCTEIQKVQQGHMLFIHVDNKDSWKKIVSAISDTFFIIRRDKYSLDSLRPNSNPVLYKDEKLVSRLQVKFNDYIQPTSFVIV